MRYSIAITLKAGKQFPRYVVDVDAPTHKAAFDFATKRANGRPFTVYPITAPACAVCGFDRFDVEQHADMFNIDPRSAYCCE